jgi:DNA-binding MarR family transcriptional regulator
MGRAKGNVAHLKASGSEELPRSLGEKQRSAAHKRVPASKPSNGRSKATAPLDGMSEPTSNSVGDGDGDGGDFDIIRDSGVIDLERYVPAVLTWIANKLARGASQHYLRLFDTGIETWRCLVLLAIRGSISAQQVSRVIGMDKASVSRCFKSMHARGLITLGLDANDGRLRIASLTPAGRQLHDAIRGIALERERAFLSVLGAAELETLIDLLKRLHENLPAVDRATERYVAERFPPSRRAVQARPDGEVRRSRG